MEHHVHGVRVKCYFYVYIPHSLHKQRCRCVGVEDQEFLLTALLTLLTVIHLRNVCQQTFSGCSLARYCFVNDRTFYGRNRSVNMNA